MININKVLFGLLISLGSLSAAQVYATFNVEAQKSANLAFISSGIVDKVDVDIGSVVKKNQVLAQLENSDTKAMLDTSMTSLKFAKKDFDRQVKIKKLIDEAKFDSVAYKYENAKNQYAYQKSLYNKTYLKAPFDGVIVDKDIEVGDAVSGMMLKSVFKIQSRSKRKLVLEFDQKYHSSIKVGQKFIYIVDGDGKKYEGNIAKIYPDTNPKTRKMMAEVKVSDFVVGLFGEGYIQIPDSE